MQSHSRCVKPIPLREGMGLFGGFCDKIPAKPAKEKMISSERDFRKLTSIPPRTALDVLRGVTIRIGGGSSPRGVRRVFRESTDRETDWSQIVAKHVFKKPPEWEQPKPEPLYKGGGKIEWEVETHENYDGRGNLGVILEFTGIGLTKAPFLRGRRNYGPDSAVFYAPVDYDNKMVNLILATRGDIFESQIVPAQMDIDPFFQKELYLPQLTTTHDPTSMTVFQNNKLVIVGYNPRT